MASSSTGSFYIRLFISACRPEKVKKCGQSVVSLSIGDEKMSRINAVCESVCWRKRPTSRLIDYSGTVGQDDQCAAVHCIILCVYVLMWKR